MPSDDTQSMFTPAQGDPAPAGDPPPSGDPAPAGDPKPYDGPDWIAEKFRATPNPVEAQAQAYNEAQKLIRTKTEDLREAVRKEELEKFQQERAQRVPAEAGYQYPEGWEPPTTEGLDEEFRTWAAEKGLSQDDFNELVNLYAKTQTVPDLAAEKAKLGEAADERIARLNGRATRAIPAEMHETAQRLMATAEGFELVEHLLGLGTSRTPAAPGSMGAPARSIDEMRGDLRDVMHKLDNAKGSERAALDKRRTELSSSIAKALQKR